MGLTKFLLLFFLTFVSVVCFSQVSRYIYYGPEDGLEDPFVYDIIQSKNGYLLVGTGKGLAIFDGIQFKLKEREGRGTGNVVSKLFNQGDLTWVGYLDGRVAMLNSQSLKTVYEDSTNRSKIVGFSNQNRHGEVWALNQAGVVMKLNQKGLVSKFQMKKEVSYNCFLGVNGEQLLVGTSEGLFHFDTKKKALHKSAIIEDEFIVDIDLYKNGYMVTTRHAVYYVSEELEIERLKIDLNEDAVVKNTFVYSENDIWISSFDGGLHYKSKNSFSESSSLKGIHTNTSGLKSSNVNSIFKDAEGNVWIGTYGDGLYRLADEFFTFESFEFESSPVIRAFAQQDSLEFIAINNSLYQKNIKSGQIEYISLELNLPKDNITGILFSNDGELWVSFENSGLYRGTLEKGMRHFLLSESKLSNFVYDIKFYQNKLAAATENGVFTVNLLTDQIKQYNTSTGLSHNKIFTLFVYNNKMYVGSRGSDISVFENEEISKIDLPVEGNVLDMISLYQDNDTLYIGTASNGLFAVAQNYFARYSVEQGMLSDNCTAIARDSKGIMWVGHGNGLSRLNLQKGRIDKFDVKHKILGSATRNGMKLIGDELWIAMSDGLVIYNAEKDQEIETKPFLNIEKVIVNDQTYGSEEEIVLGYGDHKVQYFFRAISFNNLDQIKYRYKLIGFDDEWHLLEAQNPNVSYNKLPPGRYQFKVQACINGKCTTALAEGHIDLDKPYWLKWWFYVVVFTLLGLGVFLFVWLRTKNLKKVQALLEHNLDIKTREVVRKNELLQEINKDITDSIDYAKHIQDAILPESEIISNAFSDHFVFFKPRDIVSGDFYWAQKVNNHLLVVCADCTGHGVPGAMMSMIGSLSITKSVHNATMNSPAEVLQLLDIEVRHVLQKNSEGRTVRDGMDLTMASIDLETNNVKIASAKRNFIISTKEGVGHYRGDRSSIGGEDNIKEFVDHEFQLEKGDILYFFTDGFPDQIGGAKARKIMTSGVVNMVESYRHRPLQEQGKIFEEFFEIWKKDEMQLDDVLVMGLQL